MKKYLSIFGTRPQYIKVLDNLDNHILIDTGQHYDKELSNIFTRQLKIRPKYKLGTIELGEMTDKIAKVIKKENPDIVLVYGDTRSTLAGTLAAKFANKVLAHIESGMRSYDMAQPEELIRIVVDRISDFRFCVNEYSKENLRKEQIYDNIFVVGDPMWDALNKVLPVPKTRDAEKYNVLTMHRQQNVDNKKFIEYVFEALKVSEERFIFPCHPRTKRNIKKFRIKIPKNIELIKPQGYKQMIKLLGNCKKAITDSGGITREAYWFGKPVIILRWETEWNEVIEDGWGVLVGDDRKKILEAIKTHNPHHLKNKRNYIPKFGSKRMIKEILEK